MGLKSGGRDLELPFEIFTGGDGLAGGDEFVDARLLQGFLQVGFGLCEIRGNSLRIVGAGADYDTSPTDQLEIQCLRTLEARGRAAGKSLGW